MADGSPVMADARRWHALFASEEGPPHPSTRLVLFCLYTYMNARTNEAFPSQATIARQTGLTERSVRTHLKKAAAGGWLQQSLHGRTGRGWAQHHYLATIPAALAERAAAGTGPAVRRGAPEPFAAPHGDQQPGPAIDPRGPATDPRGAEIRGREDRKGLPTNLNPNSQKNLHESQAAELLEQVRRRKTGEAAPAPSPPSDEHVAQLIAQFPSKSDEVVARMVRTTADHVARVRRGEAA
jgi:hypothetical protein